MLVRALRCGLTDIQLMNTSIPFRPPGYYANAAKKPVVYDPVGVGASDYRKAAAAGL